MGAPYLILYWGKGEPAWILHIGLPIFIIHIASYFARPGGSDEPYWYIISYGGTLATFSVRKENERIFFGDISDTFFLE